MFVSGYSVLISCTVIGLHFKSNLTMSADMAAPLNQGASESLQSVTQSYPGPSLISPHPLFSLLSTACYYQSAGKYSGCTNKSWSYLLHINFGIIPVTCTPSKKYQCESYCKSSHCDVYCLMCILSEYLYTCMCVKNIWLKISKI